MVLLASHFLIMERTAGQSNSIAEQFAGQWKITFAGAVNGNGTMSMDSDGKVAVNLSIGKYGALFSNPVTLNINEGGSISGHISLLRLKIGSIIGVLSPYGDIYGEVSTPLLEVGTVAGRLSKNSGKGTFRSAVGEGTWSAERQ